MKGLQHILREPLVHFLALGAAIFALFAVLDDAPPPPDGTRIVVSEEQARRLAASFAATWRRPPSVAELDGLIDNYVREEIYVREALALGLDRDDSVVRQRLRQKMEFWTESGADAVAPTEAELRAHYEANADRFAREPRVVQKGESGGGAAELTGVRDQLTGPRSRAPDGIVDPGRVADVMALDEREAIQDTSLLIKCGVVLAAVFTAFVGHSAFQSHRPWWPCSAPTTTSGWCPPSSAARPRRPWPSSEPRCGWRRFRASGS